MPRPVALMTGVGRLAGLGAGIARRLASDGWDLALNYWSPYDERQPWGLHETDPHTLQCELRDLGAKVVLLEGDLNENNTPRSLFERLGEELGPCSALVLCHCESVASGIMDTSVESFERHLRVNVIAGWQLIREFARQIPDEGGCVLALTSDHTVGNLPYGASKGALDRVVLAAARELASKSIRANVINPGPVDTGWMDARTREALIARQPSGRLGIPDDLANLVSFLLSGEGTWINGQSIKSDGGFSA